MAFGSTPVSTTTLSTNQFPVSGVAEPGLAGGNLTALEGGPGSVDSNGNRTAPASMYLKGGNFIDFGAQADSAATTDTGTFSYMALFKRALQKLTTLNTNTTVLSALAADQSSTVLRVSNYGKNATAGDTPVAVDSAGRQTSIIQAVGGTTLGTDQSNTMLKVSMYGTNAVAGDTAFPINASGNVKTNINGISGGVTLPVRQGDVTSSGSITAAQSTEDTPVSNATVALTLGNGQTSWAVDLRGTFNAGTTIAFDGTLNGTNWFSVNGVPLGSTSDTEVSSVTGGAPLQYQGNAAGLQQVRVRASVLQVSDSVTVTLIGSAAPDGGFLTKALPAGSASIGAVTANAGTNLNTSTLAVESGGNLASAKADLDLMVPGVQGWIAATGTGTATTDDTLTFAQQVRKVYLHNASTVNVPFEFDTAAAATSDFIEPGQRLIFDDIRCTTVHVFPSATLPINTTSGLYVKGWK